MIPLADWLQPAVDELVSAHRMSRFPHAVLISGPAGSGKSALIQWLVPWLHCRRPQEQQACGACESCQQHAAGSHPDYLVLQPEEVGKEIRIDAIRSACFDLSLTSHYGGYRILLIQPAEAMNASSANALLKTLEEPPAGTLILLVSDRPAALPATVRSRCRKLRVAAPVPSAALDWLQGQGLAPAQAQALLERTMGMPYPALALAGAEGEEAGRRGPGVAEMLDRFAEGRLSVSAAATALAGLPLGDLRKAFTRWIEARVREHCLAGTDLANQQSTKLLFELWDQILYWPIDRSSGLDLRLLLEETLIRLGRALTQARQARSV